MPDSVRVHTFTAEEKRLAATRAARLRRQALPRLVQQNRMTRAQAEREIAVMEAIADDYRGGAR